MANPFDQFDAPAASGGNPFDQFDEKPKVKEASAARKLGDLGLSVAKGVVAVPEAAVGLADLVSGGRAGKFLENEGGAIGFRPKQAKEFLTSLQSDDLQSKQQQFQQADGVVDKFGVAVTNPSLIANAVAESVPLMGAGAVPARALLAAAPGVGAVGAGAIGEGLVGAGSAAEQIRQETKDGLLTGKQALLAGGSGAATAAFGAAGGKVAQRLGIADVDTALTQGTLNAGTAAANKGLLRRTAEGVLSEGVLEELPQSLSEQALQNIALDKPVTEGLADAGVMGVLAGGVMGGGAAALTRQQQAQGLPDPDAGKAPAPALGYNPKAGTHTVFPDGTVVLNSDTQAGEQAVFDKRFAPQPATPSFTLAMNADNVYQGWSNVRDGSDRQTMLDQIGYAEKTYGGKVNDANIEQVAAELGTQFKWFRAATPQQRVAALNALRAPQPVKPSQAMGIDPNAGAISRVAAEAVDGPASMEMAVRQAEAAIAAEDSPDAGADPLTAAPDPLIAQVAGYVAEMGTASPQIVAAKFGVTTKRAAELLAQADPAVDDLFPPPQGAANVSNTDAAGALAAGTGGPVGVDAAGSGPDAGLLAPATGQRTAGTAGTPAPSVQESVAAPVPGRDSDAALKKGPTQTKAKVGGLKELIARNKAAKSNVQNQPQGTTSAAAPAPAEAVQAPQAVGSDGTAQPGAAPAGNPGVEAAGVGAPALAKREDGTLKNKSEYTADEWSAYTKSVIDAKLGQQAATPSPTTTEPTDAPRSPEAAQAVETTPQGREETALLSDSVSTEPNLEAAKALLARQKAATGNAVAEGKLRKELRDLAANTPETDTKTVLALDTAATRLGMGEGRLKGLEFKKADAPAAPSVAAPAPAVAKKLFTDPRTGMPVVVSNKATADAFARSKQLAGKATVRKATPEELADERNAFAGYTPGEAKRIGYVLELSDAPAAAPAPEPAVQADEFLPEGWAKSINGYTKRPVYRMEQGGGQPFAVVTQTEGMTYEVQIRHGDKQLTTSTQRGALSEVLGGAKAELAKMTQAASVTHQDPGEKPEAATKGVVNDSLKTAAKNEDTKPSEMRKWLLAEIDKELLQAPDRADYDEAVKRMGEKDAISMYTGNGFLGKNAETGFITFDVPGDGKFKVRNSVRGLLEFRKTVNSSLGFKDGGQKTLKPEQNDGVQGGSGGQMAAVTNMIEEGDFEAARDYAEAVGIKLEDVKVPRGDMKPAWEKFLKDGTLPPAAWMPSKEWQFADIGASSFVPDSEKRSATLTRVADDSTYVATVKGNLEGTSASYTVTKDGKEIGRTSSRRPFSDTLRMAEDAMPEANDKPAPSKASDTGWNMAGTGYGGKRYTGRNITLDDGREVVARIYENAGNYDEVEIKVDGARKFTVRDSFNAQDKADAFIKTLTSKDGDASAPVAEPPAPAGRTYLAVPFNEKDYAKRAGAKWDEGNKLWYADPVGGDGAAAGEININLQQYIPRDSTKDDRYNYYGDKALATAVALNASARDGIQYDIIKRKHPDGMMMWSVVKAGEQTQAAPAAQPAIPEGFKPAGEPFYRDGELTQGYAPFDLGQRVTMKESGGQSGVIDLFTSPDKNGVFDGAMVKFDNGVEQIVKLNKLEAEAAPAATGTRRDPTKVSMFNPYNDGDIVTIDGQDWTVKADTPGWYLTTTGNWRGQHPNIRNVKAMADLIREVEQAAEAKPAAKAKASKLTAEDLANQDKALLDGVISVQDYMDATGLTDEDVGVAAGDGLRQQADREAKAADPYHQGIQKMQEALSDQMRVALDAPSSTPPQRKSKEERMGRITRDRATLDMIARGFEHPFDNRYVTKLSPMLKARFNKQWESIKTGEFAKQAFQEASYKLWAQKVIDKAREKLGMAAEPAAPAPEAPKKGLAGVRAKKAAEAEAQRAAYFTPGNVVKGYGGHDRVLEYTPVDERGTWSVRVQRVMPKDGKWVDAPNERPRWHSTQPEAKELAAGPVVKAPAAAQESPAPAAQPATVENFGEKLPPARRAMAAKLSEALSDDSIAKLPLSQIWPASENEAIEDTFAAAVAHVMREAIPAKPRTAYKVNSWVNKVKMLRDFAAKILRGTVSKDFFMEEMAKFSALRDLRSKIKLLEQIDREQWKRIGDVSEAPGAVRFEEGKPIPSPSVSVSVDGKNHWLRGSGDVLTHLDAIKAMLGTDAPENKMQFEIRQESRGERKVFINKKGDKEYRRLMEFATVDEARKAIREQYADLVAAWEGVKARDNITERDLRSDTNRERAGKDHRKGRDVTAEEFESKFGFRGGEFGKWVGQGKGAQERQFMLNSAYDALMDLSDLLGIPPKAISLEGSLGIAFGSRGSGWASAHFEPSNLVINLTKTRGAGALAHEWFHALDNYFARKRGGEVPFDGDNNAYRRNNYVTYKTTPLMVRKDGRGTPVSKERLAEWRKTSQNAGYLAEDQWIEDPNHKQGVRAEVEQAFSDLVKTLNDSPMLKRAQTLDGVGRNSESDGYWSRVIERAARAFENYVQTRMMEQGYHNDFLANVKVADEVGKNTDRYPYLLPSEIAPVADAFKALFDTIQTKEDDAGNVVMFSRSNSANQGITNQAAEQIVGVITSRWANAPEVVVVESVQDPKVPAAVRRADAAQRSQGATGEPEGFWYGGKAYIVSGALNRPADVVRVLFHEVLGHYGLRGTFGADLKPILAQIATMRKSEVQAKATEYGLDMTIEADRLQAAEEVLAVMAQSNPQAGFVKRAIGAIRAWLRANIPGLENMRLTDNDIVTQFILPARRFVQQGPAARVGDGVLAMSRSAGDVTDTPAFRKWFGDSKVVDADGKPLVVYHGTQANFSAFSEEYMGGGADALSNMGDFGDGFYFTKSASDASGYAGAGQGANVMPVYLSVKNPIDADRLMEIEGVAGMMQDPYPGESLRKLLEPLGYDGIIVKGGEEIVAFRPEQVKSAIGNNGQFDPQNPDIRFSRSPRELAGMATDQLKMTLTAPGKLSWWSKTVGTMYGLAERHPAFKPVFNAAQSFIDDVSYYATDAADLAPKMLPKLESWKDIAKSPISAEDNKAIEAPINEGTLLWARDESGRPVKVADLEAQAAELTADQKARRLLRNDKISDGVLKMWQGLPQEQYEKLIESRYQSQMLTPGVVWTDAELKAIWKLNDAQIGLYREVRAAIDKSLDNLAKSDLVRFVGKDGVGIKDAIMEAGSVDEAALMARDYFIGLSEAEPDRAEMLLATANGIMDRADKVTRLKEQGYAPLSRFGKYTVDVVTEEGRQYFGLFESMREANQMAARMRGEFGKDAVSQGTLSDESFKLFQGITPETLELFGNMLGLSDTGDTPQDQAFQAYLKLTKNNRSAMKRLIQRKGILGYSQDVGRVLANFIYSNARQTAGALHIGDLTEAVNAIPQSQGELKDEAVRLAEYIQNPQEEAQAFRGLLFAQYLGGSIASAMVNMTQPLQVSLPYLSQFGGVGAAGKEMMRAIKGIATGKKDYEPDLARALKHAEEDGTVSPQEVHQLMAQARGAGTLRSGDGTKLGDALAKGGNAWAKMSLAWGKVFGVAEQMNRRSTFIAAYRLAKAQKMADPAGFAKKAVQETQFIYSKANKMRWGRGAIGGVAMTFKSYSVSYLELLHRMATQGGPEGKRAAMLAVAVLLVMGGAGGLPFMEDAEDITDAIAQVMGYNFSTKKAKQELLQDLFGEAGGQFIERGVSGLPGVPLDVTGRLGMGNLIPGTGLFLQKNSNTRDVLEIAGPAGDLAQRVMNAGGMAVRGNLAGAVLELSPKALRDLAKGADMANTGMYRDAKGFKVIDTTAGEAGLKAIGFQPNTVAQVQESNYLMQRQKDYYNATAQNIRAKWARGLFEKDEDMVAEARAEIASWNEKNPDQRMSPNMPAIWKRVREMAKDKDQRIADTAPKAMRQQFREETARVREAL